MKYFNKIFPLILFITISFATNVTAHNYTIINMAGFLTFGFSNSSETVTMSGGTKRVVSNPNCIATKRYSIPVKIVDSGIFNRLKGISENFIYHYDPMDKMFSWYTAQQNLKSELNSAVASDSEGNICGGAEVIFFDYKNKTYAIISK